MWLDNLFLKYGTDKGVNGYAPIYEFLFANRQVMSLLEIGIGTMDPDADWTMVGWALPGYKPGGSLRAWRDYLPDADICGMDTQLDCMFDEERIFTFLADSQHGLNVRSVLQSASFDVIIDDADHTPDGQVRTFINLHPYLNNGGLYVIEDAHKLHCHAIGHAAYKISGSEMKNDMLVVCK